MNIVPRNSVSGVRNIDNWTYVVYGTIGSHEFNLWVMDFDGKPDYTMYLDGNTDQPYFLAEREEVAKRKIMELMELLNEH